MKTVAVSRKIWSSRWGIFGRLTVDGNAGLWVLEPPEDRPQHPAIPAGTYDLVMGWHHPNDLDRYQCYHIIDQAGQDLLGTRTEIEQHVANFADELLGCQAPGEKVDWMLNRRTGAYEMGVWASESAFQLYMSWMDGDTGGLTITEDYE